MRTLVLLLILSSAAFAIDEAKECRDRGLTPAYNSRGELTSCYGTIIPKDCTTTVDKDGATVVQCGPPDAECKDCAVEVEPEVHESQAKPQGQI